MLRRGPDSVKAQCLPCAFSFGMSYKNTKPFSCVIIPLSLLLLSGEVGGKTLGKWLVLKCNMVIWLNCHGRERFNALTFPTIWSRFRPTGYTFSQKDISMSFINSAAFSTYLHESLSFFWFFGKKSSLLFLPLLMHPEQKEVWRSLTYIWHIS